jgi:uncharacterized protein (DUF1501 family)
VRFTLVYLSDYGEWDSHNDLKNLHARSAGRVDKPLAGLIKDLKRTGLDRAVLVVCCTEFGRTPGSKRATRTRCRPAATITRTGSPSGSTGPGSSAA